MKLFTAIGEVLQATTSSIVTAANTVNKSLQTIEHVVTTIDTSITIADVALQTSIDEQQLGADEAKYNLELRRVEFQAKLLVAKKESKQIA